MILVPWLTTSLCELLSFQTRLIWGEMWQWKHILLSLTSLLECSRERHRQTDRETRQKWWYYERNIMLPCCVSPMEKCKDSFTQQAWHLVAAHSISSGLEYGSHHMKQSFPHGWEMSSYFWESFWDGYAAHWKKMPCIMGTDRILRMEYYSPTVKYTPYLRTVIGFVLKIKVKHK